MAENTQIQQTTRPMIAKEEAMNAITEKISKLKQTNDIVFPTGYSVANAVNSAWLILQDVKDRSQKPALDVCSKQTIIGSLYNMCLQGLSPAKKQCYFVVYGNQLTLMRSYLGTIAVTKRLKGVKDVKAYCLYEGDEFEREFDYNTGVLKISKYNPKFNNQDQGKIIGAFAMIIGEEGPLHTEVMTMDQIVKSWNQGAAKGKSGAHQNFADEMAKKTVINRACKMYANTSDDSDTLIDAFNNSDSSEEEYQERKVITPVQEEIKTNANSKPLDIQDNIIDVEVVQENNQQQFTGPGF